MKRSVVLVCLAAALLVSGVSPSPAADPAVSECGQVYLRLERVFAQRALRLGRLLCESPERVDAAAAGVVRRTNAEIAVFNAQYSPEQCDPDIALPVPPKTVADVRRLLEGQLRSVPLDRFCNGVWDPLPLCGNGQADLNELCDGADLADQTCQSLGQGSGTLGCSTDCQAFVFAGCTGPAYCGNGVTEADRGEACDTAGATATCDSDCTAPVCGDGFMNAASGEQCDDGNATATDDCAGCQPTYCGDGAVNAGRGEQCDDGNENVLDDCADCRPTWCGDGRVNSSREQCDDFGPTRVCDEDCTLPACGDGVTNRVAGEACDDGNVASGDGCSAQCAFECVSVP
jgi:cysteine-rich repeat protein